ncbi:hypothetical protein COS81_00595 [candidate division WWE3 bacterium CG06_land_8_20_14_3_00_42_16]|uniref:Uncharacterized protein n=2 Tax=Katanobacteria TaxID=422282 RepID=A0A2M7APH7_UNCKA|nr:MAG: hypothetical protein COS81_00595 [candidate division WWE3 bacterium CG06_land_8_20_14_3_00_42_16]PJA37319.1 MAG: hypothetical protein CO181_04035 [candidate division WWE3 bacterium CG_4_9_14_3_um_filter_43_9]
MRQNREYSFFHKPPFLSPTCYNYYILKLLQSRQRRTVLGIYSPTFTRQGGIKYTNYSRNEERFYGFLPEATLTITEFNVVLAVDRGPFGRGGFESNEERSGFVKNPRFAGEKTNP